MPLPEGCPDWILPNADGASYYRWSLPPADLDKLRSAGFAKLSARDKLSFADSLRAAFASAALPADSVLAALPAFAADADRSVATMPMELLRFAREYLLEPAQRARARALTRARSYAARLQKLGWKERAGEDGDTKMLRSDIIDFLARGRARPAGAQERGGPRASAGSAARPRPDRDDVPGRSALGRHVRRAARRRCRAVRPRVQALFRSDRSGRTRSFARALSSVHRCAQRARARADVRSGAAPERDHRAAARISSYDERTRAAAYQYLQEHLDALIEKLSKERAGDLPWFATPMCSTEMADQLQALFAPRIEQLTGGPRSLANAVESLRLCAAASAAQQQSARAFFAAHH